MNLLAVLFALACFLVAVSIIKWASRKTDTPLAWVLGLVMRVKNAFKKKEEEVIDPYQMVLSQAPVDMGTPVPEEELKDEKE